MLKHHATQFVLKQGDITREIVDAIVNAANSGLQGGGGVDGAIHRAAGPSVLAECRKIRAEQGPCPAGNAVATGAGKLTAKYVIHAVGPIWRGGAEGEAEILFRCYQKSLSIAAELRCRTIAFPAISAGAYGYPLQDAASIALRGTFEFISGNQSCGIEEIRFVLFTEDVLREFERALLAAQETT